MLSCRASIGDAFSKGAREHRGESTEVRTLLRLTPFAGPMRTCLCCASAPTRCSQRTQGCQTRRQQLTPVPHEVGRTGSPRLDRRSNAARPRHQVRHHYGRTLCRPWAPGESRASTRCGLTTSVRGQSCRALAYPGHLSGNGRVMKRRADISYVTNCTSLRL